MTRAAMLAAVFLLTVGLGAATAQDGRTLYMQYCGACHGVDGKGTGPAAPAMKTPPSDLTMLQKPGEAFPAARVVTHIDGTRDVPAHGSREMPMYGDVFKHTKTPAPPVAINTLVDYLKTLQMHK